MAEPGILAILLTAAIRGGVRYYCEKHDMPHDLAELVPFPTDLAHLSGRHGKGGTAIPPGLEDAVKAVVRDLQPVFDDAPRDLNHEAVVNALLDSVRGGADLIVQKNLDPRACTEAFYAAAVKSSGLSTAETDLLRRVLNVLAERIVDAAHLLSGWNTAFPREVLERLSAALGEIADLRRELAGERGADLEEFERAYRLAVQKELNHFEEIGLQQDIDRRHIQQELTVSYVSLYVEAHGMVASCEIVTADEILGQSRRLVIRGEAGAGKTTLLRWIAVQTADRRSQSRPADWGDAVPFFLRLRKLPSGEFPGPGDLIGRTLTRNLGEPPISLWPLRQLKSGNAVVLIDGVDELPEEARHNMLKGLREFVEEYPHARYIISSRPHAVKDSWSAWAEWIESEGFTRVTLRPMDAHQIGLFIDKWHDGAKREYPETFRRQKDWPTLSVRLRSMLARPEQRTLANLAATPLLGAMICALHANYGERIPTEKKDLYREFLDALLRGREDAREMPTMAEYPDIGLDDLRILAQQLAYRMMEEGKLDMPEGDVERFFTLKVENWGRPDLTGVRIRRLIQERCNLLCVSDAGGLAFKHKSFQEYLAAKHVDREGSIPGLAKWASHDAWRGTIIWASILIAESRCEQLLLVMIESSESEQSSKALTTALACLAQAKVSSSVREQVTNACERLFPPTLETAADVAAAGDPAVEFLMPKPGLDQDTGMTCGSRAACVRALAFIGTPAALAAIESHARAPEFATAAVNDPAWRGFVRELGAGWENFDVESYAVRVFQEMRWSISDPAASGSPVPCLVDYLIGDGAPPDSSGAAPRWWALWLAASLCEEHGLLTPGESGLPERVRAAMCAGLTALLETPAVLPSPERALCGRVLSELGDTRPGVDVKNGLPDIVWCDVPAGPFLLGSTDKDALYEVEKPQCIVDLPAFRISKYPVTYAQFQAFLDDPEGYANDDWWVELHADGLKQKREGPRDQALSFANHPCVNVSWYEAMAFCKWLSTKPCFKGVTLPTEVQWEKAARGADGRIYPYGGEFDPAKANTWESEIKQTSSVGAFPGGASPYGALDMSGNVFEWTSTVFQPYPYDANDGREDAGADGRRVLRGGSWSYYENSARAASRNYSEPVNRYNNIGFRLASPAIPESLNTESTGH